MTSQVLIPRVKVKAFTNRFVSSAREDVITKLIKVYQKGAFKRALFLNLHFFFKRGLEFCSFLF